MSEIKAALTPEEWVRLARVMSDDLTDPDDPYTVRRSHAELQFTWGVHGAISVKEAHLPAVAALALHGQPFGFTWEIHRALSEMGHPMQTAESIALAQRGLALIAALLPPRTP